MTHLNILTKLAYCAENEETAAQIMADLAPVIRLEAVSVQRDQAESMASLLKDVEGPIILLISDNFLRSTKCMEGGLGMLNEHVHSILPIVIPGYQISENGEKTTVETSFDRVTDIIQYINFWQDRYLDLRRQKREDPSLNHEGFANHLKAVRDISGEAGEFIRLLRSDLHLALYEFQHNAYEQIFIFLDETEVGDAFRARFSSEGQTSTDPPPPAVSEERPSAETVNQASASAPGEDEIDEEELTVDLTSIPGLGLLPPEVEEVEENIQEATDDESLLELVVEEEPSVPEDALDTETEPAEQQEAVPKKEETEKEELETSDEGAELLVSKAWRLVDAGASSDGLTLLEAGLGQYPEEEHLLYNYALLLAQEDRTGDATLQVNSLLNINPQHENGLFLAGELADLHEQPEVARDYFARLVRINEQGADVWYRLGQLSLLTEPNSLEKAAKYFKEATKRDGVSEDAYYQLGLLYAGGMNRPDKAQKAFRKTLDLNAQHPFAHYDLALLYHQEGQHELAYQAYQQAIILNPEVKTPDNDAVFKLMAHKSDLQQEQSTLQALKSNIERLEALIQQREATAMLESEAGKGKTVLITGATSGIGRATAAKFAANGFRIIITGRRQERLEALKKEWSEQYGTESYLLSFDVRSSEAVQRAIDSLPEEWATIDILVNNAGKARGFDPIHEGQLDHWEEMIDTNIKGLLYLTRAIAPRMVARQQGHIVNVASTAGKEVYPKGNVYCATKFAVDALTRGMRLDMHQYGIRVSQVAPAHVEETEFAMVRFDGDAQKANIYEGFQPLTSKDVAETIYFLTQQPAHVNILDVVMQGTQQASSMVIDRSGRERYQEEE
jgi:NADP-dependent 3-hydroxy acid dehydrogenase YdfG/Tfp pilus assembly protein PilF